MASEASVTVTVDPELMTRIVFLTAKVESIRISLHEYREACNQYLDKNAAAQTFIQHCEEILRAHD
jgi:hypothetical protein